MVCVALLSQGYSSGALCWLTPGTVHQGTIQDGGKWAFLSWVRKEQLWKRRERTCRAWGYKGKWRKGESGKRFPYIYCQTWKVFMALRRHTPKTGGPGGLAWARPCWPEASPLSQWPFFRYSDKTWACLCFGACAYAFCLARVFFSLTFTSGWLPPQDGSSSCTSWPCNVYMSTSSPVTHMSSFQGLHLFLS